MNTLLVMLGGGIGAMLRYVVGVFIMKRFQHPPIPIAMLTVNVIGSFGLGVFLGIFFHELDPIIYESPLFLLIGLGFFGAFTTFSTFSVETVQLLRDRKIKKAFIYVGSTIIISILFFYIGFMLGNR